MGKYYESYEERYQAVEKAGIPLWGHSEENGAMLKILAEWVEKNHLAGKRILDFACGEASAGIILSRLGCQYTGVDISETVVQKARKRLCPFPHAQILHLDMTKESPAGIFDAALDCSGFHMLVTDEDRMNYLHNAHQCLAPHAPYLFLDISYQDPEPPGPIDSIEQWAKLMNQNYETPEKRTLGGREVYLRTLPARGRSRQGYEQELTQAGFSMDSCIISNRIGGIPSGCIIHAHKM